MIKILVIFGVFSIAFTGCSSLRMNDEYDERFNQSFSPTFGLSDNSKTWEDYRKELIRDAKAIQ